MSTHIKKKKKSEYEENRSADNLAFNRYLNEYRAEFLDFKKQIYVEKKVLDDLVRNIHEENSRALSYASGALDGIEKLGRRVSALENAVEFSRDSVVIHAIVNFHRNSGIGAIPWHWECQCGATNTDDSIYSFEEIQVDFELHLENS